MTFKIPQRWKRSIKREIALLTTFALLLGYSMPISAMGESDSLGDRDSQTQNSQQVMAPDAMLGDSLNLELADAVALGDMTFYNVTQGAPIVEGSEIRRDDELRLTYEFTANYGQMRALTLTDKYYLPLPLALWGMDGPFDVLDENDVIFAKIHIDPDTGRAYLMFEESLLEDFAEGDDPEILDGESYLHDGLLDLKCKLSDELFEEDGPTSTVIRFSDTLEFTVYLPENVKDPMTIVKNAPVASDGKMSWTVTYTPGDVPSPGPDVTRDSGRPYVLEDYFKTDELILDAGSIQVLVDGTAPAPPLTVTTGSAGPYTFIRVILPDDADITGNVVLSYDTVLSDQIIKDTVNAAPTDPDIKVENKAGVMGRDEPPFHLGGTPLVEHSAEGTVPKDTHKVLSKEGELGTAKDEIVWTVKLSTLGRKLGDNIVVTDDLPEGLRLDPDSIQVTAKGSAENLYGTGAGKTTLGRPTGSDATSYEDAKNNFTLTIPKPNAGDYFYSDEYTIIYTTKVNPAVLDAGIATGAIFSNSVSVSSTWKNYGGSGDFGEFGGNEGGTTWVEPKDPVILDRNIIQKDGAGYDRATHTITWKVTVNPKGVNVKSGTLTDNLHKEAGKHMTYLPNPGNAISYVTGSGDDIKFLSWNSTTGELKFTVGDIGTRTVEFTFQAKVDNEEHWAVNASNTTYDNTIEFDGVVWDALSSPHNVQSRDDATETVRSNVLSKSNNTGVTYDYEKNEVVWTLTVNDNGMPMNGVVLTDELGKVVGGQRDYQGQSFVTDSGKVVIDPAIPAAGITFFTADGSTAGAGDAATKMVIDLGDITGRHVITYRSKVDVNDPAIFDQFIKKNTPFPINNDAGIKYTITEGSQTEKTSTATGGKTITPTALSKGGNKVGSDDDQIDYKININANSLKLDTLTISDHMPEGLILDKGSVKLYHARNVNGTLQYTNPKTPADASVYEIEYSTDSEDFSITLTDIDSPYILALTTYVEDRSKSPFTNKISSDGSVERVDDTGGGGSIGVSSGSGGGSGTINQRGSATLYKKDGLTGENLAGATFSIYELVGGNEVYHDQRTSGSDGYLKFVLLKPNTTYIIRETGVPAGYTAVEDIEIKISATKDTLPTTDTQWSWTIPTEKVQNIRTAAHSFSFSKKDNYGAAVDGVEFTATLQGTAPGKEVVKTATSTGGTVTFTGLPFGTYTLTEAQLEHFEDTSATTWEFTIAPDGQGGDLLLLPDKTVVANRTIVNVYKKAELQVRKMDANTELALQGAKFELQLVEGADKFTKHGDTLTSNEEGMLTFTGLIPGKTYRLVETKAPNGYSVGEPQYFTVGTGEDFEALITYEAPNFMITEGIEFTKVTQWGATLEGATFRLKGVGDYNGDIDRTATSDRYGKVRFDELIVGKYIITEESVTDGNFEKSDDRWEVEVSTDGTVSGLRLLGENGETTPVEGNRILNLSRDASLSLRKTNEVTRRPMANVEFTLLDGDTHAAVATGKTDRDGNLTFTGLLAGKTYLLRETTPAGYLPVKDVTVTVDAGDENALALQNRRVPSESGDYWPKDDTPPEPTESETGTNTPGNPGGGRTQEPDDEEFMSGSTDDRDSGKIRDTGLDWMTPLALGALGLALLGGAALGSKKEDGDDSKTA